MRISDWSSDVCSSDLQYPSTNRLMYNSKRSPAMIAHLTSPGCLSLIRSISAPSSSWGGGSTFGAPNLNLVISLAPLDRVLHTSSRSESQLNPTPTYALDAPKSEKRRDGKECDMSCI